MARVEGHPISKTLALIGATGLAVLAGYAVSGGGGKSSPVIDNAPISDSFKPPEPPPPHEVLAVAAPQLQPTEVAPPLQIEPQPANTPTPAPELVLPPKPENFLPEYSIYFGQMREENGTGRGSVIIANIPGRPEWLYAFSMANRNIGGYIFKINTIDSNNLEASGNLGRVNITLAKDAKTLSGSILWKRDNTSWLFDIQNSGRGREAMLEAAKKLWAREIVNDLTLWQNVPDKTILDAMFDGKGILLP